MSSKKKNNYFILTGAMGAGKSTLLSELRQRGFLCIDEPARQILAEQRSINGAGVPERDSALFVNLMLSRSIHQYNTMGSQSGPVIYDRGIPDNLCYEQLFNLETVAGSNAAQSFRYNSTVFFLPAWEAIYENDDERKMRFEQAKQFGDAVKTIYQQLGYEILDVPMIAPPERAQFIVDHLNLLGGWRLE